VLAPIWHTWQDVTDHVPRAPDRALGRIDLADRPIRPITRKSFDRMATDYPYYRGRWRYTSVALAEVARIIHDHDVRTALELGAPVKPILDGAHVMDIKARPELDPSVEITVHNAIRTPWPFEDNAFDLFVALQVFEHLKDQQPEVFREVRRIARHAIISLPIEWPMDDPTDAHHMIPESRVLGWFAPVVPTRIVQGNAGPKRRMVYVFEDLAP
jgi:SAM-dependent methyltransferase